MIAATPTGPNQRPLPSTDTAPAPLPTTQQEEAAMSDSTDSEMVAVLGHDVRVVEYQGQRVVTLRQIDELHERPAEAARKQFGRHRDRFEEGRDVFTVPYKTWTAEFRRFKMDGAHGGSRGDIYLITERGYGKIVKGWNDDQSWALLDAMRGYGKWCLKLFDRTLTRGGR